MWQIDEHKPDYFHKIKTWFGKLSSAKYSRQNSGLEAESDNKQYNVIYPTFEHKKCSFRYHSNKKAKHTQIIWKFLWKESITNESVK